MVAVLIKITRYLRQSGMSETRFGRLAVGDPRLVHDLRGGRQPGPELIARVDAFIADRRSPASRDTSLDAGA